MTKYVLLVATVGALSIGPPACAQHIDVLVQAVDGKLVTGAANYDNNTWLVGQRVYKRQLLSNFRTPDPGFTSLATGNPLLEGGVQGLTPGIDLLLDIVPTTIDGQRANFWYWDGVDTGDEGFELADVEFDLAPPGVTWNVFDEDFELHTADGSDTVVPGALIQKTFSSDGAVHNHLVMQVADGDGDSQTDPPQGIYLSAMVLRAEGFEDSEPYMFVHRTSELTNEPRDVAAEWVQLNYEFLVGNRLQGDYDLGGSVDGGDFLLWQRNFGGTAIPAGSGADGNMNGFVDAADYAIWRDQFGTGLSHVPASAVSVPEPTSITLVTGVLALSVSSFYRNAARNIRNI